MKRIWRGRWEKRLKIYAENDAEMLKTLALVIGYADGIESRDIELGLRVAQKAYEISGGKTADICHAYAKMQFMAGRTAEAVELQKRLFPFERIRKPPESAKSSCRNINRVNKNILKYKTLLVLVLSDIS